MPYWDLDWDWKYKPDYSSGGRHILTLDCVCQLRFLEILMAKDSVYLVWQMN